MCSGCEFLDLMNTHSPLTHKDRDTLSGMSTGFSRHNSRTLTMQEWIRRNTQRDFFEFSRVKAAAIDGNLLLHVNEQWVGENSITKKT